MDAYALNINKKWQVDSFCSFAQNQSIVENSTKNSFKNSLVIESEIIGDSPMMDDFQKEDSDDDSNNIIEGAARSKVSRSSMGSESMGLSCVPKTFKKSSLVTLVLLLMYEIY